MGWHLTAIISFSVTSIIFFFSFLNQNKACDLSQKVEIIELMRFVVGVKIMKAFFIAARRMVLLGMSHDFCHYHQHHTILREIAAV